MKKLEEERMKFQTGFWFRKADKLWKNNNGLHKKLEQTYEAIARIIKKNILPKEKKVLLSLRGPN